MKCFSSSHEAIAASSSTLSKQRRSSLTHDSPNSCSNKSGFGNPPYPTSTDLYASNRGRVASLNCPSEVIDLALCRELESEVELCVLGRRRLEFRHEEALWTLRSSTIRTARPALVGRDRFRRFGVDCLVSRSSSVPSWEGVLEKSDTDLEFLEDPRLLRRDRRSAASDPDTISPSGISPLFLVWRVLSSSSISSSCIKRSEWSLSDFKLAAISASSTVLETESVRSTTAICSLLSAGMGSGGVEVEVEAAMILSELPVAVFPVVVDSDAERCKYSGGSVHPHEANLKTSNVEAG